MTRRMLCAAATLLAAGPCAGHGFGERYDLPLPLWLYLAGAGATVALTFALLARLRRTAPARAPIPSLVLPRLPGAGLAGLLARILVLALTVLVIVAGLTGNQSPVRNIAPAMVWAIWWVGMAYVSALVGDLWSHVNPLDTVFRVAERSWHALSGRAPRPLLHYRPALGMWPAALLLFAFVWMELNWEGSERPASLACAMLAYATLTWTAMALFGRQVWLVRGEVFAIVFSLLARFAPLELHHTRWRLRPYAAGLLVQRPAALSQVVLVMVMLASVSLDGMLETEPWQALVASVPGAAGWAQGAALVAMPLLFLLVYLGCCALIGRCAAGAAGRRPALLDTAGMYALTLVPISIAYHFAHYLSFLAMAGQYLIPLSSDPFGLGWDLFGTSLYFIRLGIVDARAVWYVSLFAIVAGHVAAVWLAHRMALRQFVNRSRAIRSQYPMLALMVGYTLLSLWIIAQPIVSD
jgi:hypothetical protein